MTIQLDHAGALEVIKHISGLIQERKAAAEADCARYRGLYGDAAATMQQDRWRFFSMEVDYMRAEVDRLTVIVAEIIAAAPSPAIIIKRAAP